MFQFLTIIFLIIFGYANLSEIDNKQPCIPLNSTALTLGSGKMSNVVLRTLCYHHILEVEDKISDTVPLKQIVEQDGVVSSVCVSHKTKILDSVRVSSNHTG